jgi:uncharacterized repeat protein (TIGR03943 family)
LLGIIGIISTLSLAATGKLELYIHPRYVTFTIILSLIGAALIVAGFTYHASHDHDHDHDHEHDDDDEHSPNRLKTAGSVLTVIGAVVGMLVLPPSTLTSATVNQRDLNSSGTLSRHQTAQLIGADQSTLDVREWASLLRYDSEHNYLTGKTATITGFVAMDKTDPTDVFYIARFAMTCCTVDAQPVGVPVHHPNWQKTYKTDTWVTITGTFRRNPDTTSKTQTIFIPENITPTSQPTRPYVY